jgi:DNA modification methylase
MNYKEFLEQKEKRLLDDGFEVSENDLNKSLFPFQKFAVKLALKVGRFALFLDTGMGKTICQLEWANWIVKKTNKPVLILAPLAVSGQTIQEGKKFDIHVEKLKSDVFGPGIYITNYEQLKNIDTSQFSGIVLDESSILKNYTGTYKRMIIEKFDKTPYKLPCTATPSPNDYNEIGNHSEFLNVLDAQDMRARWFVRDEGMNNYRLKKYAKKDFFSWINSWCTFACKPSDLGFDDEGFNLPGLEYNEYLIQTKARDNGKLFNDVSVNATNFNFELRQTKEERFEKVIKILEANKDEHFIVWVKQNEEADYLNAQLQMLGYNKGTDFVEVRGNETPESKEEKLLNYGNGKYRILITKAKIAQFGMNFQVCHNQIFAALDFSFEGLYQAIRRSYRFGQKSIVNIHLITVDTMQIVIATILNKEKAFNEMKEEMNKEINNVNHGLVMDYIKEEVKTENYHLIKGDSCQEIKHIADDSQDFSVFSPPFSSLFTYSNNICDMGNCDSHDEFFAQYEYLLHDLYRIMKPGRLVAVHTKDLAKYKNSSGYTGLYDFTSDNHKLFEKVGFKYHSKVTIWTDPVLEMQRTKTQRLLYKQLRKDSTYTGVGLPEYLTIFRKWEGNEEDWIPVTNKTSENFPLDLWQKWASPVWMDIRRTDVLNNREGTDQGDEKHIAPLQLTVIDRAIKMWTNEGEYVFTPFLGIGSEAYMAIKNNRFATGIELKDSYFNVAVKNCNNAIAKKLQTELFD